MTHCKYCGLDDHDKHCQDCGRPTPGLHCVECAPSATPTPVMQDQITCTEFDDKSVPSWTGIGGWYSIPTPTNEKPEAKKPTIIFPRIAFDPQDED